MPYSPLFMSRRRFLTMCASLVYPLFGVLNRLLAQISYGGNYVHQDEINRRIGLYGVAKAIPALEYHGDKYDMFEGAYSMDSETFANQMRWFRDHDVHPVTGAELLLYLAGQLDLPARAVILTTDSSKDSRESIPRMINILGETGLHFHSFICTYDMNWDCPDWSIFEAAIASGHFTIGCHSEYHSNMRRLSASDGLSDLQTSKAKIEQRLGITINSLTWPFEAVPTWIDQLEAGGFSYAFAGTSREMSLCAVLKSDYGRWNLPRVFPPNPSGYSGRPGGLTLQEIMELYNGVAYN